MDSTHEDTFGPDAIRDQGKKVSELAGTYEEQTTEWNRKFWLKVADQIKGGVSRPEARDLAEAEMLEEEQQLYTEMRETRREIVQYGAILQHASVAGAIEQGAGFSTPAGSSGGSALA